MRGIARSVFPRASFRRGSELPGSWRAWPVLLLLAGCASEKPKVAAPVDARVRRSTEITLEACSAETAGAEKLDANGDGRPEVVTVRAGSAVVCVATDLDMDGRPDRTVFYDGAGAIRRIESDFDRDGRVDEIALFDGGVVRERHRATTLAGKLDTWEVYEQGRLVRTERDENGDGYLDQWWEYPVAECPMIHSDTDGDGRPEPAATIDYCKATGYVPPAAREEKEESPTFVSSGLAPVREVITETVTEEAPEGAAPAAESPTTEAP